MTPPTVNAYYDPQMNNVNFPAGYLQPPFFSGKEDDAANYGDMGSTIGHELTHGFDDEGRQFDKDGNLKDWWTKEDEEKFNDRADCMVKQYDARRPKRKEAASRRRDSMSDKRQKIQLRLAFGEETRSEAPQAPGEGSETPTAKRMIESPAKNDEQLMEEVCERENCLQALKRVKSNKGSSGIDGMTVDELPGYLKEHWPAIREQLLSGTYKPQPVKRVEIPKPDGGVRQLGIPTVLDRMVQQAVMQVLQSRWDAEFSEHSYGFRPGRSAHQAVAKAQQYIAEGRAGWLISIWRNSSTGSTTTS
jgi:hypothetical protein